VDAGQSQNGSRDQSLTGWRKACIFAACRWLVVVGRFGGFEIWERKRRKRKGRRYFGLVTLQVPSKGVKGIGIDDSPYLPQAAKS